MKLISFFADVFCVVTLLTLGSLMIIVSLHILPMEDALIKVQALYESSSESWQLGLVGGILIAVGLYLSKRIVKQGQREEGFFSVESDSGQVTVAYSAVTELIEKVLQKYEAVRKFDSECNFNRGQLDIKIDIEIAPEWDLKDLTQQIKQDVEGKVQKMLRSKIPINIKIGILKIASENLDLVNNQ